MARNQRLLGRTPRRDYIPHIAYLLPLYLYNISRRKLQGCPSRVPPEAPRYEALTPKPYWALDIPQGVREGRREWILVSKVPLGGSPGLHRLHPGHAILARYTMAVPLQSRKFESEGCSIVQYKVDLQSWNSTKTLSPEP